MNNLLLERAGIKLHGEASGDDVDFLLLHAGGETRKVWRPIIQQLAEMGVFCAAYDLRGHGESEGATRDGIEAYGEDAAAMLAKHGGGLIVVGASLGGFAGMLALANEHNRTNAHDQAKAAALILVDVIPAPDPERVRAFLAAQAGDLSTSPLVDDILGKADLFLGAAEALHLPILLIRSGEPGALNEDELLRFQALCPQLKIVQIKEAGHLIARDAPAALAAQLLAFKQSLTP